MFRSGSLIFIHALYHNQLHLGWFRMEIQKHTYHEVWNEHQRCMCNFSSSMLVWFIQHICWLQKICLWKYQDHTLCNSSEKGVHTWTFETLIWVGYIIYLYLISVIKLIKYFFQFQSPQKVPSLVHLLCLTNGHCVCFGHHMHTDRLLLSFPESTESLKFGIFIWRYPWPLCLSLSSYW